MKIYALMVALGSCGHVAPPAPTPVPPIHSAATCQSVCAHEQALGCTAGRPTQKGASCEEVCGNVEESGVVILDLSCMDLAITCAAIDACGRRINN